MSCMTLRRVKGPIFVKNAGSKAALLTIDRMNCANCEIQSFGREGMRLRLMMMHLLLAVYGTRGRSLCFAVDENRANM